MKKSDYSTVLVGLIIALFSGCVSMQTSSVYNRNSETKLIVIQEKIEDGVKTGALTADQSRMYLATLKDTQTDNARMRGKNVSREERNNLVGKLDVLGDVVNRALAPPKKTDEPKDPFWERVVREVGVLPQAGKHKEPTMGNRIISFQRRIDDGIHSGAFSLEQGSDFQTKLDYIRSEYLRMMEGGRSATIEERALISRLMDCLDNDLTHVPRI